MLLTFIYLENCTTTSYRILINGFDATSDTLFFGATAPISTLAYLHETLRFTSVF
jgi:hypothetical protein